MEITNQPTFQKLIGHCMPAVKTVYGGIELKGTGGLDHVKMLAPIMDMPILKMMMTVQAILKVSGGAELQTKYFIFNIIFLHLLGTLLLPPTLLPLWVEHRVSMLSSKIVTTVKLVSQSISGAS